MAIKPPTDPAALRIYNILTSPTSDDSFTFYDFIPGPDGTDDVCHLRTEGHSELDDYGERYFYVIEVFFSRSGTALLQLADERRRRYSRTSFPQQHALALFFELEGDPAKGEDTDIFETTVFEVVVRPNPWYKNVAWLKTNLIGMPHITSRIPPLIPLEGKNSVERAKNFRDKLVAAAERAEDHPGFVTALALNTVSFGLRFAGLKLGSIAYWLNDNSRMPKGLWNPSYRPPEMTRLRDDLVASIGAVRRTFGQFDLGLGHLADWAEELPLLGEMIGRINDAWAEAERFVDSIATLVEDALGSVEDTIDAVVAYVCGLWDGIIEAIIGTLEFAGLILRGLAVLLAEKTDLGRIADMVREATEEVIQAFTAVDWQRFGQRFMKEIAPMIVEVVKKKVDVFIDEATRKPAVAAYYFGYLVYMIAEFFFPPLKFGQITKAARAARTASTARFLKKVAG